MKIQNINKWVPYKRRILRNSTHLYKFYSFKFIEFKPKFFKFEGPQSLETIQRRYNYNNYSLHQSSKGILTWKSDTNSDRRIIFTNFNFNPSSNNPDTLHGQQSHPNLTHETSSKFSSKFNFKNDNFRWRSNSTFGIIPQTSNRQQWSHRWIQWRILGRRIYNLAQSSRNHPISFRRNKSKNGILHLHQRIQTAAILQIHARSTTIISKYSIKSSTQETSHKYSMKLSRTSISRTTLQHQFRPQQTSLTRNKQWKTSKSTPQWRNLKNINK